MVINGASEFLGEVFGAVGRHSRLALGVSELPLNAAVEVEMIAKIRQVVTQQYECPVLYNGIKQGRRHIFGNEVIIRGL